MKNYQKTLREFNSQRKMDLINRAAFYFLLGSVFTALVYYIAVHSGAITIIYN